MKPGPRVRVDGNEVHVLENPHTSVGREWGRSADAEPRRQGANHSDGIPRPRIAIVLVGARAATSMLAFPGSSIPRSRHSNPSDAVLHNDETELSILIFSLLFC